MRRFPYILFYFLSIINDVTKESIACPISVNIIGKTNSIPVHNCTVSIAIIAARHTVCIIKDTPRNFIHFTSCLT